MAEVICLLYCARPKLVNENESLSSVFWKEDRAVALTIY